MTNKYRIVKYHRGTSRLGFGDNQTRRYRLEEKVLKRKKWYHFKKSWVYEIIFDSGQFYPADWLKFTDTIIVEQ